MPPATLGYNAGMDTLTPPRPPAPSAQEVRTCIEVLRAIEADRSQLTQLSQDQRRELLILAGLVAKPERHDQIGRASCRERVCLAV